MSKMNDIQLLSFPMHASQGAVLSVYEYPKGVPFQIARVFVINAAEATERGAHAHYECQQLLVCLQGRVQVMLDDGQRRSTLMLESSGQGVLIPAGLWAEQRYEDKSILMVLASHSYNEADYIRDYAVYLQFKAQSSR